MNTFSKFLIKYTSRDLYIMQLLFVSQLITWFDFPYPIHSLQDIDPTRRVGTEPWLHNSEEKAFLLSGKLEEFENPNPTTTVVEPSVWCTLAEYIRQYLHASKFQGKVFIGVVPHWIITYSLLYIYRLMKVMMICLGTLLMFGGSQLHSLRPVIEAHHLPEHIVMFQLLLWSYITSKAYTNTYYFHTQFRGFKV